MTENLLKNPKIFIGGKEITPTISVSLAINNDLFEVESFYFSLRVTDENIQLVKSTKEQVEAYQNTRYNNLNLESIKNPATLSLISLEPGKRSIPDSIILDIDYKIIDFNGLHIFHMIDDDNNKRLIDPATYFRICSNHEINKIIVYGVFKEIDKFL